MGGSSNGPYLVKEPKIEAKGLTLTEQVTIGAIIGVLIILLLHYVLHWPR